ncbi:hypothetical protein LCGC14_0236110 [marine sediment metagenome]|uniref:Uncharacterized protein n=1 Tax=marine sediment metagenome TaxID=412755 RepID=A0A0F9U9A1_9ZZZZ
MSEMLFAEIEGSHVDIHDVYGYVRFTCETEEIAKAIGELIEKNALEMDVCLYDE